MVSLIEEAVAAPLMQDISTWFNDVATSSEKKSAFYEAYVVSFIYYMREVLQSFTCRPIRKTQGGNVISTFIISYGYILVWCFLAFHHTGYGTG